MQHLNLLVVNFFNQEYLPYLRTAAKASGKPGMSCDKAAVINISTDAASMSIMPVLKEPFPFFPYSISKVFKSPKTDGLQKSSFVCGLKLN